MKHLFVFYVYINKIDNLIYFQKLNINYFSKIDLESIEVNNEFDINDNNDDQEEDTNAYVKPQKKKRRKRRSKKNVKHTDTSNIYTYS